MLCSIFRLCNSYRFAFGNKCATSNVDCTIAISILIASTYVNYSISHSSRTVTPLAGISCTFSNELSLVINVQCAATHTYCTTSTLDGSTGNSGSTGLRQIDSIVCHRNQFSTRNVNDRILCLVITVT